VARNPRAPSHKIVRPKVPQPAPQPDPAYLNACLKQVRQQ
jgi:hypothetical protein